MRLLVFGILLFFTVGNLYSQIETQRKKLEIPADSSAVAPPSDVPKPQLLSKDDDKSIFINPNLKSPEPLINRDKDLGFGKRSNLLRAGTGLEQKYNRQIQKEDENMAVFKRNQHLGDVKTKGDKVKIVYRDHQLEDGDMIKIMINGEVVQFRAILSNRPQGIDVMLNDGFNTVDFKALNQGTSGPNTAELHVYDDAGNLLSAKQWNLATGYKATIIVVKE